MFSEMEQIDKGRPAVQPVSIMATSGARGSKQQIRQLAGLRGLMAKSVGERGDHRDRSRRTSVTAYGAAVFIRPTARARPDDTALKTAD